MYAPQGYEMARKANKEKQNFHNLPGEEWRLVKGTEEYYISNKGRFRKNNKLRKICVDDCGYCRCNIGKQKYRVHRLVAEAFLPNPDNLPIVEHRDDNKQNNNVDNLFWSTQQANSQHAKDHGLGMNRVRVPIFAWNQESNIGILYPNQMIASEETTVDKASLNKILGGREKSRKGWRFFRVSEFIDKR